MKFKFGGNAVIEPKDKVILILLKESYGGNWPALIEDFLKQKSKIKNGKMTMKQKDYSDDIVWALALFGLHSYLKIKGNAIKFSEKDLFE